MPYKDPNDLNMVKRTGPPPRRMASPITTSDQPNYSTTLGDIIGAEQESGSPADPLDNCGGSYGRKSK